MFNPLISCDLSNKDYHSGAGISKSDLDLINKSMLHFFAAKYGDAQKESTTTFDMGSALHSYVLEPERFPLHFFCLRDVDPVAKDMRSPVVKEKVGNYRREKEAYLKSIGDTDPVVMLKNADMDAVLGMGKSVHSTVFYRKYMRGQKVEVSFFSEWHDMLCKCRTDCWNEEGRLVADLKTVIDASPEGFKRAAAEHRYYVQAAFYREVMRACGKDIDHFVFVAVEKKPPYATAIYEYDAQAMDQGLKEAMANIDTYMDFMEKRGNADDMLDEDCGFGGLVRSLSLPPWKLKANEEREQDSDDGDDD